MRAIRVGAHGGPEALVPGEVPDPRPESDEVLIRVAASGVNFVDVYHRTGLYPSVPPFIPGTEAAGTVTEMGSAVSGFAAGDRVAVTGVAGSYAELMTAPADQVVAVPDGIDDRTAAAVLLQGMTAHYLVHDSYPLGPGDRCLIHAGAGGVGRLVIQMAKRLGAEVATTVSTDEKEAMATACGADLVIRYTDEDLVEASEAAFGPHPFDVVYDSVGADTFDAGLDLLRPRGTMVLFGQSSGSVPPLDLRVLNVKGSLFVTRPTLWHHVSDRAELEERAGAVFDSIASGDLDVLIGGEYPLADAADAHRALEGRRTMGKLLLVP